MCAFTILTACAASAGAQTSPPDTVAPEVQPAPAAPPGKTESGPGQPPEDKRVFGVLPNYRTAENAVPFQPITTKQKFVIATKDSFDYPVFFTTAFFAGLSQLEGNENRVYGQGVQGFAHRYGISYVDQVVGNYFPEAIIPALFHEDPRYFRKGAGSIKGRTFYALSRIVVCKTDSGATALNANEFVGNSVAAIATMAYHPHERTAGDAVSQFLTFVATDAAGQVMKEFWPDIKRWYINRHRQATSQP